MRSDAKRTPILAAYLHPRDPRCISTPTRSSLHIYTHAHRYPRPGTTAVPLIPASPPSERGGTGHTSRHHRRPSDPGITAVPLIPASPQKQAELLVHGSE